MTEVVVTRGPIGDAASHLFEPELWELLDAMAPRDARRCLAALVEGLDRARPSALRSARDRAVMASLAWLCPAASPPRLRGLLRRHLRCQALRTADDLLLALGEPSRLCSAFLAGSRIEGAGPALELAAAGRPALVLGAHLGPMSHYIPGLAYHLARAGHSPEILAVVHAPSFWALPERALHFGRACGARVGTLVKQEGDEVVVLRRMLEALERGAWITFQLDARSGGIDSTPVPFACDHLALPALRAAARLAGARGIAVLGIRASRAPSGKLHLKMECPLPASRLSRHALEPSVRALACMLERWVLDDPADWGLLAELGRPAPGES